MTRRILLTGAEVARRFVGAVDEVTSPDALCDVAGVQIRSPEATP